MTAVPAGVSEVDGWYDDDQQPYRILHGIPRSVDVTRVSREGLQEVRVYTHAVQLGDGTISNLLEDGGPGVSLDSRHADDGDMFRDSGIDLSPNDARVLAARLLEAADGLRGGPDDRRIAQFSDRHLQVRDMVRRR